MPVQVSFSPTEMGVMPAALRVLTSVQQFGPGGGRVGNLGLGEQILVVPPGDHAHVPRHAVILAILGKDSQRTGCEGVAPGAAIGIQIRGDVLEQTSIDLFIQGAAAPALEDIGGSAALHDGGQLGLEGLVFQDGDIDVDIRMCSHIFIGHVLPEGLARVNGGDMPPFDGDLCGAAVAAGAAAAGRQLQGLQLQGPQSGVPHAASAKAATSRMLKTVYTLRDIFFSFLMIKYIKLRVFCNKRGEGRIV